MFTVLNAPSSLVLPSLFKSSIDSLIFLIAFSKSSFSVVIFSSSSSISFVSKSALRFTAPIVSRCCLSRSSLISVLSRLALIVSRSSDIEREFTISLGIQLNFSFDSYSNSFNRDSANSFVASVLPLDSLMLARSFWAFLKLVSIFFNSLSASAKRSAANCLSVSAKPFVSIN